MRGSSRANALRRSAYAVTVVDTEQAKRQTIDLGEVLARETPVTVQRVGGLGSRTSFALGGLGGERLRFFLDGVPLELMGYSAGLANVPVNLVDRIEVYQGVVPVRFGADALGGAVHLVTDQDVRKNRLAASYQVGSFGTHRATLSARYFHAPSGVFARSATFFDVTNNDYDVDVTAYDDKGRERPVTVPRFHDGYRGVGTHASVGIVDKPWADRLVLQGFVSAFDNDVQNGATMDHPYGEVTSQRRSMGANVKYAVGLGPRTHLEAIAGFTRVTTRFRDRSNCTYDWYGHCTPPDPPVARGESSNIPIDRDIGTSTFFLRSELAHHLSDDHLLRFALAPTFADRAGNDWLRGSGYDPLAQPRRLVTGVVGMELESSFFDGRVKNSAFVKGYGLASESHQLLSTGQWSDMSRDIFRGGGGDSVRVSLTRQLSMKASYEHAMRQPSTDELFGDGILVAESLGLRPETSHNANLGVFVEDWKTPAGTVRASANGFARWTDDLIAQIVQTEYLHNENVAKARALGVESALGWTVPGGDWLTIDGHLTYQDLRNRSSDGPLAAEKGDRIPSIPYLLSSASVRLRGRRFFVASDVVELSWNLRYVHSFYRDWESRAAKADKREIDTQVAQGAALTYALRTLDFGLGMTFEVQNLTDAKLFDFYGVQRPGRAFFTKWTLDY
ncbi:TonB-dependent receptor domain-containing protein [Pendulispora albinea]|uniref:TonB-dependent receptor n=1 Tax=Pendulispora albinea TaxID=2741071 RepID=A0ABZ2LMA8_9BACT